VTWVKVSDDFPDDCARVELSDAAFRTHMEGLCWVMRRETGGHIDDLDVRRFAESERAADAIEELIDAGFWTRTDGGYVVVHHMKHQVEPDVIAKRRENDAERQRRKRRKDAGLPPEPETSRRDNPRDVQRDNPRDPGLVGSGLDRVTSTTELRLEEKEQERARENDRHGDPWSLNESAS
jgi:hypothetical protein